MIKLPAVMQSPEENPKPRALSDAKIFGLMAQTGCLVLAGVIASLLAGIWLDRVLQTRPVFTLVLVLGSAPLMLYALYRMAVRATSQAKPGRPSARRETHDNDDE